jgi:hypothetical protein
MTSVRFEHLQDLNLKSFDLSNFSTVLNFITTKKRKAILDITQS